MRVSDFNYIISSLPFCQSLFLSFFHVLPILNAAGKLKRQFIPTITLLIIQVIIQGDILLPHSVSVISSTRRTETPTRYIFDKGRLLHTAFTATVTLRDGCLE